MWRSSEEVIPIERSWYIIRATIDGLRGPEEVVDMAYFDRLSHRPGADLSQSELCPGATWAEVEVWESATGDVAYSQVGYSVRREACEAEFRQSFPEAAAHRELRASSEFEREMRETRDKRRQPR